METCLSLTNSVAKYRDCENEECGDVSAVLNWTRAREKENVDMQRDWADDLRSRAAMRGCDRWCDEESRKGQVFSGCARERGKSQGQRKQEGRLGLPGVGVVVHKSNNVEVVGGGR